MNHRLQGAEHDITEVTDVNLVLRESGISELKSINSSAKKCDVKTNLFLRELVGWQTCNCVVMVLEEKIIE